MASRPMVTVQSTSGEVAGQTQLPEVFSAPIRADIIQSVHTNMAKNHRQAHGVKGRGKNQAGVGGSALSWGTGRAVSRIPRTKGGGSHAAGQGAYGNMCRGGHMFNPLRIWRRWHRKINLKEKRYAVKSALAASAVPALVMARGHRVDEIAEVPCVVSNDIESITKTSKAIACLKSIGAGAEVAKCKKSNKIRTGTGKMRNRRFVQRRGPLVVFNNDEGISKSFRNIPGVDICSVDRLNLLQLAPGGHLGRFVIFSEGAFQALDAKYSELPISCMTQPDLNRLINSDEVQSVVNMPKQPTVKKTLKRNPLKNRDEMEKLNPFWKASQKYYNTRSTKNAKALADHRAVGSSYYKQMVADSDFKGDNYDVFSTWLETEE